MISFLRLRLLIYISLFLTLLILTGCSSGEAAPGDDEDAASDNESEGDDDDSDGDDNEDDDNDEVGDSDSDSDADEDDDSEGASDSDSDSDSDAEDDKDDEDSDEESDEENKDDDDEDDNDEASSDSDSDSDVDETSNQENDDSDEQSDESSQDDDADDEQEVDDVDDEEDEDEEDSQESEDNNEQNDTEEDTSDEEESEASEDETDDDEEMIVNDDDLFSIDVSISPVIGTVGIVEWSIDADIDEAKIEFGRDKDDFELTADADLSGNTYRTLLLGMKASREYFLQISASGGGKTYKSDVYSVETDPQRTGLPTIAIEDHNAEAIYGGFTIACTGATSGGGGFGLPTEDATSWGFIFDKDGDMVWWYELTGDHAGCSRARMSFDGNHMWFGNFSNVSPDGALMRVTMDGMSDEESWSFPGRHHDFAILPEGKILFYEQENGGSGMGDTEGPDIIKEFDPESGDVRNIYHENDDFAQQIADEGAHTNHICYVPHMNAISFSMRHTSTIGLISYPDGQLIEYYGGPNEGFGISWDYQHGHHRLKDSIVIFNNTGNNGGSSVLEYDVSGSTGQLIFEYSPGVSSGAFGDAKRLPNGNTFITYSTAGTFHEVDKDANLLRAIETENIGYAEHRLSLYGPPPPFADEP